MTLKEMQEFNEFVAYGDGVEGLSVSAKFLPTEDMIVLRFRKGLKRLLNGEIDCSGVQVLRLEIPTSDFDDWRVEKLSTERGDYKLAWEKLHADMERRGPFKMAAQLTKERDSIIQSLTEAKRQRDEFNVERDRYRAALERIESEDNGWAGFEAAKALKGSD